MDFFFFKCESNSSAKAKISFYKHWWHLLEGKCEGEKWNRALSIHAHPNCLVSRPSAQHEQFCPGEKKKKGNKKKEKDQQLPAMLQEEFHMELTKGNRHLKAALVLQASGVISDRSSRVRASGERDGGEGQAGAAVTLLSARKRGKNAWPIRFQSRILSLMDRKH